MASSLVSRSISSGSLPSPPPPPPTPPSKSTKPTIIDAGTNDEQNVRSNGISRQKWIKSNSKSCPGNPKKPTFVEKVRKLFSGSKSKEKVKSMMQNYSTIY